MSYLRRAIEKVFNQAVEATLDRELPHIIEKHIRDRFERTPPQALSAVGFRWAWVLALEKHWPEVSRQTAARWLTDYLPAPIGTPGYAWTASAAADLARLYVEEFGEAA